MINAELLKLIRNRQLMLLTGIWVIIHILTFLAIKNSYINSNTYSYFSYNEKYYNHVVFYLKFSFYFTFLLIPIGLISAIKSIQTVDIDDRISFTLIDNRQLKYNTLKALLISVCVIYNIIILLACIGYYILYGSDLSLLQNLTATLSVLLICTVAVSAVTAFFFIINTYIKKSIFALTIMLAIWVIGLFLPVNILPLQWAYQVLNTTNGHFPLYSGLLIATLIFSYLKFQTQLSNYLLKVYFMLVMLSFVCNKLQHATIMMQYFLFDSNRILPISADNYRSKKNQIAYAGEYTV